MIQKYILLCALCFMVQLCWGQKAVLKNADKAFEENDFYTAIAEYKMLGNPDAQAKQNLAESYYQLGDMAKAANAFESSFNTATSLPKELLLHYADAEKAENNYKKANELLSKYAEKPVNIEEKLAENVENLPFLFYLQLINGDSKDAEFGPTLYNKKLVFSSDKNMDRPIYKRTQQPFLDLYSATVNGNTLSDVQLFSEAINTPLHEGNAAFTEDGKTMYFTRTNDDYKRINGVKIAVLQLFRADFIDGEWQNVEKLSINSDSFSMAHPALSKDGNTLYFTSDMPGGYGAGDIYKVDLLGDNSFGTPVNLGASVNTAMQEQFPYISENGNLYFASDRFMGLGGLDIYRSDLLNGAFAEAYNLGTTINSNRDDFSLVFEKKNETGYLSSNRSGTDKIYHFTATDHRKRELSGIVTNAENKKPLENVNIAIFSTKNGLKQHKTNAQGSYNATLLPNQNYRIEAQIRGFEKLTRDVKIPENEPLQIEVNLQLQPVKNRLAEKNIDNIYFDFDKALIRPEAVKILDGLSNFMMENPEIKIAIASHTDAVGSTSYNKILSEKRAKATKDYLTKTGVAAARIITMACGEQHLLVDTSTYPEKDAREAKNRRSEFKIVEDQD